MSASVNPYEYEHSDIQSFLLGIVLAAVFIGSVETVGQSQRQRTLMYGYALIVAALIYVLFDWIGHQEDTLLELMGVVIYGSFPVITNFNRKAVAVGWLLHPIWDICLHLLSNRDVAPVWYAIACLSFDFIVSGFLFRNPDSNHQTRGAAAANYQSVSTSTTGTSSSNA